MKYVLVAKRSQDVGVSQNQCDETPSFLSSLSVWTVEAGGNPEGSSTNFCVSIYRDEINSLQIQLSRTQAGPCRAVKEQQEQNSPNHVQRINLISVETSRDYASSVRWFCS